MSANNAVDAKKTVSDANAEYESLYPLWKKTRAICGGEDEVKLYDLSITTANLDRLLIPFSDKMTIGQYKIYLQEAELPGIVAEFAKMLVGGLLRKPPTLQFGEKVPDDAQEWILNNFAEDNRPMMAFLDEVLWDELQTGNTWIHLDMPPVEVDQEGEDIPAEPYPVIWKAETVINWTAGKNAKGEKCLTRIIVKGYTESFTDDDQFHPDLKETVWVHELGRDGLYQVRVYEKDNEETDVKVVAGKRREKPPESNVPTFKLIKTIQKYKVNSERINFIPAWPLNGDIKPNKPLLTTLVHKEVALYNKVSRRNHLLLGAATYTPVVKSDMAPDDFDAIVDAGLGSWIQIGKDDDIDALKTPTDSLQDMEKAIMANIEEMAKLGVRMLSPENDQSGVALEIRNASQNAQLGSLNVKISNTMKLIISTMVSWRYDLDLASEDVDFTLSDDFNPIPLGADWLRLVTEWYENRLIPRSLWLEIVKKNDLAPGDYDDEAGREEINGDELVLPPPAEEDFSGKL